MIQTWKLCEMYVTMETHFFRENISSWTVIKVARKTTHLDVIQIIYLINRMFFQVDSESLHKM